MIPAPHAHRRAWPGLSASPVSRVSDRDPSRRSSSATGVPSRVISASQRAECLSAALPPPTAGTLIGALGIPGLSFSASRLAGLATAVVTVLVTAGVATLVARLLRPRVRDAVSPGAPSRRVNPAGGAHAAQGLVAMTW